MEIPSIAPTLVDKAKMKFSEHSWMDFGTVNLDQDPPAKYHGRYDKSLGYSTGSSEEAQTQQLLVGSTQAQPKGQPSSGTLQDKSMISTVVYKLIEEYGDSC